MCTTFNETKQPDQTQKVHTRLTSCPAAYTKSLVVGSSCQGSYRRRLPCLNFSSLTARISHYSGPSENYFRICGDGSQSCRFQVQHKLFPICADWRSSLLLDTDPAQTPARDSLSSNRGFKMLELQSQLEGAMNLPTTTLTRAHLVAQTAMGWVSRLHPRPLQAKALLPGQSYCPMRK